MIADIIVSAMTSFAVSMVVVNYLAPKRESIAEPIFGNGKPTQSTSDEKSLLLPEGVVPNVEEMVFTPQRTTWKFRKREIELRERTKRGERQEA